MGKVGAYHTSSAGFEPRYHIYDDCPAGDRVIKDGNNVDGQVGYLCHFCANKEQTGKF
jgi:hypothetical protein